MSTFARTNQETAIDSIDLAVGPVCEPWSGVKRIGVVRGGGLGELLTAVPALEALEAAYPQAEIILLGEPPNARLLADRPGPVRRVIEHAKTVLVNGPANVAGARSNTCIGTPPVDLGVQLDGGGRWSDSALLQLKPRLTVGTCNPDGPPLTRWLPYRHHQHEVLRWLEIVGLAGAPPVRLHPHITVTDKDFAAAQQRIGAKGSPLIAIHPGACDPRRRWPATNFAEIVTRCVRSGAHVLVIGSRLERALLTDIAGQACDQLSATLATRITILDNSDLSTLCGVLALCDVLVGNESGLLQLAGAVDTPTVRILWTDNAFNFSPLGRSRDRILVSWTARCPVCGRDCSATNGSRCTHDVSFVSEIPTTAVFDEIADLLS